MRLKSIESLGDLTPTTLRRPPAMVVNPPVVKATEWKPLRHTTVTVREMPPKKSKKKVCKDCNGPLGKNPHGRQCRKCQRLYYIQWGRANRGRNGLRLYLSKGRLIVGPKGTPGIYLGNARPNLQAGDIGQLRNCNVKPHSRQA